MSNEELQNLSLSKRQADRLVREVFNRHYKKEKEKKKSLEEEAKRYDLQYVEARFNGVEISREEILEVAREKYLVHPLSEEDREKHKKYLKNSLIGLVAGTGGTTFNLGIYFKDIGENGPSLVPLICSILCAGLTIYQSIRIYNNYRVLKSKEDPKRIPKLLI